MSKTEGRTKFLRRLEQFDGLTWMILTPPPHILREIYASGRLNCAITQCCKCILISLKVHVFVFVLCLSQGIAMARWLSPSELFDTPAPMSYWWALGKGIQPNLLPSRKVPLYARASPTLRNEEVDDDKRPPQEGVTATRLCSLDLLILASPKFFGPPTCAQMVWPTATKFGMIIH